MDRKAIEFWRNHSPNFLTMVFKREKHERLETPDGYSKVTRECGDTLEIFLAAKNGRIDTATFQTDGCIYIVACGNAAVTLAQGKNPAEALAITPTTLMEYLETLPPEEEHCAEMAVRALRLALSDLQENVRQPWRKLYRR